MNADLEQTVNICAFHLPENRWPDPTSPGAGHAEGPEGQAILTDDNGIVHRSWLWLMDDAGDTSAFIVTSSAGVSFIEEFRDERLIDLRMSTA